VKIDYKDGALCSLLNRLLKHADEKSEYDPWERLRAYWSEPEHEWDTAHVEARVGRCPILGIGNAPIDRAVQYACSDAYWTRRVAAELERRRNSGMFIIAEVDADA
jgi:hypothetical protein